MLRDEEISVVLVDENDNIIGYASKLDAHRRGLLHRAFSVLLFNDQGELLIHKRSPGKYHARGLWSNTCSGHPFAGERNDEAAIRRVKEELGIQVDVELLTHVYYKRLLEEGMIEHKYAHIFISYYKGQDIRPDPMEISEIKWIRPSALQEDLAENPNHYAPWFAYYINHYYDLLFNHLNKKKM